MNFSDVDDTLLDRISLDGRILSRSSLSLSDLNNASPRYQHT